MLNIVIGIIIEKLVPFVFVAIAKLLDKISRHKKIDKVVEDAVNSGDTDSIESIINK